MKVRAIYLDNNASTPVDPRVHSLYCEACEKLFGNPSNTTHNEGQEAASALEASRERIRDILQATDYQVIFASSATEAINLAILGLQPTRVLIGKTEHKAVLEAARSLGRSGATSVSYLPVDRTGKVSLQSLREAFKGQISLLAVMLANNETGTLNPIEEIGFMSRRAGVPFLCDLTQAIGRVPVRLDEFQPDLAVFSSHKIFGPKGAAALLVKKATLGGKLVPTIWGGGQEFGLRPGTQNVPAAVAFSRALDIAVGEQEAEAERLRGIRDEFERILLEELPGVQRNGDLMFRLPNTSSLFFDSVDALRLLTPRLGLSLSTGSACTVGMPMGSYVLRAMGLGEERVRNSIRASFGRFNLENDGEEAAGRLVEAIRVARVGGNG